ncbi:hypothetical protein FE80_14755, partial [Staphylococcus aureus]
MVDLGYRPHLLSDRSPPPSQRRAELALDLRTGPAGGAVDHAGQQQGGGLTFALRPGRGAARDIATQRPGARGSTPRRAR